MERNGNNCDKMITLVGSVKIKMDDKNRFRMPICYRSKFKDILYISIGFENSLEIWDTIEYKHVHKEIMSKPTYDSKWRKYKRLFMANTFEVPINNIGRVLLPQPLVDFLEKNKNLILIGVGNHLELWSQEVWEKYNNDNLNKKEEFAKKLGLENE